jgi:signal transduction histidine kinase
MGTNITYIRQLQSQLTSLGLLISSISHGIKGLLTGLDGGIYLVNSALEKNKPERLKQGWKMVERNVARIRSMVLDILYYAKDREPNWEMISALALGKEVCEVVQARAREEGVEIRQDFDPAAGEFEADGKAVHALLVNLLENALDACRVDKKKSSHQILVGVKGDPESVEFQVCDDGNGMDQETREKAFSLFFSSKGTEGTGLGLFISNKIAQAHGGSIRLESEVGRGTCFKARLPRKRPARAPRASEVLNPS